MTAREMVRQYRFGRKSFGDPRVQGWLEVCALAVAKDGSRWLWEAWCTYRWAVRTGRYSAVAEDAIAQTPAATVLRWFEELVGAGLLGDRFVVELARRAMERTEVCVARQGMAGETPARCR